MSRARTAMHRRILLAAAISMTCAFGPVGVAAADTPAQVHVRQASYTVDSAPLGQGLYQSAYSARNNVLWVTSSVGFPRSRSPGCSRSTRRP